MAESPVLVPNVLLEGLALGESPRWHDGRLWLSDWLAGEVMSVDATGTPTVELTMSGLPFCFDWLPDGRLLIVSNADGRKLLRREHDGTLVTHAELVDVSPYPWNEIVVDAHGNAYLNSIGYDMMSGEDPKPGVLARVSSDGTVRQVADDLHFPNGMVITPDGSTLIVAESHARRLTAFDITGTGDLVNRRIWAEVDGYPDGICLDAEGAVWAAAMERCLRIEEGGRVLARVELDRAPFACMLGAEILYLDRAPFACMLGAEILYIVAAEWKGAEGMTLANRTGRVLTVQAPAARAGHP